MRPFLETLLPSLANWSGPFQLLALKSFVLLALVFAAMRFWGRSAAAARHWAWTMAFVGLMALPLIVWRFPVWSAPAWMVPFNLNGSPNSLEFGAPPATPSQAGPAFGSRNGAAPTQPALRPTVKNRRPIVSWAGVLLGTWLLGIMAGVIRVLTAQMRLARLTSQTPASQNPQWLKLVEDLRREYRIRRPVKLLIPGAVTAPMTWGVRHPVIALPPDAERWDGERIQLVLRHELAHVRRWDCLTQEMAHLVCVLYWYNPLAWLAARRMRAERERACDDFVLNAGARPSAYAGHLVDIAQQFAKSGNLRGAMAMARPSGLEQRIAAILDRGRNRNRIATMTATAVVLALAVLEMLVGGCRPKREAFKDPAVAAQLKGFVVEKEAQAKAAAAAEGEEMLPECQKLFAAAERNDWQTIRNVFNRLRNRAPHYEGGGQRDPRLSGIAWATVLETYGAFGEFADGGDRYVMKLGQEVVGLIPAGSIYFGGTDPGRFVVTALQKSQVNGDPFFTLTQNALADGGYRKYLQSIYGGKIYTPTDEDSQKCFQEYYADAERRLEHDQRFPEAPRQVKFGETVTKTADGKVQVAGHIAVMEVNARLVRLIFDQNPDREFYIEESFPLDWMYPHLEPHGLIMKINRQPLPELADGIVESDHDYWSKFLAPLMGDWLNDKTSVRDVCAFVEKVYARHNLAGFKGDPEFVRNVWAQKFSSKLRASIAGVYAWRLGNASSGATVPPEYLANTDRDRERMTREADFAFRQAFALCPYSPEAVFRYANFLMGQKRIPDAILIADTASRLDAKNSQLRDLASRLKNFRPSK